MRRFHSFLLVLVVCIKVINCSSDKYFNGMRMGKRSNNRWKDGCPDDAMRCDDKCIFESDNWTTPCLVKAPWSPCVHFQYPHYCPSQKTCLTVLDQCEGECVEHSTDNPYYDYPKSYKCGQTCANKDVPCNGSCDHPKEIRRRYDYVFCGDQCVYEWEGKKKKICDGKCVHINAKCDGNEEKIKGIVVDDCPGMIECTSCEPYYQFKCKDGNKCIETNNVCDEREDCNDGSDEDNCKCFNMINDCKDCNEERGFKFMCKDGKRCIEDWKVCNGNSSDTNKDCEDGSDELCIDDDNEYCKHGMRRCGDKWVCNDKVCLSEDYRECGYYFYLCNSTCIAFDEPCGGKCPDFSKLCNGKCIREAHQCNGVCSDEIENFACPASTTLCVNKNYLCDGDGYECFNNTDEAEEFCKCPGMLNCTECMSGHDLQCNDKKQCIRGELLCDGNKDCNDGSDESDWGEDAECPGLYYCNGKYICKNEVCVEDNGDSYCNNQLCDGKCINNETPCGGKCLDRRGEVSLYTKYCPEDNKCITAEDGICGDKCISDDYRMCGNKCIYKWDSNRECNGDCISEEMPCNGTCEPYKFLCGLHCISVHSKEDTQMCDGKCVMENTLRENYKNNPNWTKPCDGDCLFGFRCLDGSACLTLGSECNGVEDCPDGSDEDKDFCNSCHKYVAKKSYYKDRRYFCITQPLSEMWGPGKCFDSDNYYICGNKCILKTQFCQETQSCSDNNDFHCGDQTCINGKMRCNGVKECKDGSDEKGCPDCSKRHGTWLCDGQPQCMDTPCDPDKPDVYTL